MVDLPDFLEEVTLGEVNGFKRRMVIRPAFDKRDPDPKKDKGIGGVSIYLWLIGEKGAVSWEFLTEWMLPETKSRLRDEGHRWMGPTAGPVSLHSRTPTEEDGEGTDDCLLLGPDRCYDAGGSYTWGERPYEALVRGGFDAMWACLEGIYYGDFGA